MGIGLSEKYCTDYNIETQIQNEIELIVKENDPIPNPKTMAGFYRATQSMQFPFLLELLLDDRKIDNNECYRLMKIPKATYYKSVKTNPVPSKRHIIRIGIGLKLSVDELEILLNSAGYMLSLSLTDDIIVKKALENKIYDINKVSGLMIKMNPNSKGL